eukprot:5060886-Ditylum_brightwellii.AAC.1
MAYKVYRTDNPSANDNPTEGWSKSLKYYKKALNFFMPIQQHQWNKLSKVGNPTRSDDVNDLIEGVMKKEV